MNSAEHAAVGAVVSTAGAAALGADPPTFVALVGYGVALSVGIDLDHFPLARAWTGDWSHLRRCLHDPVRALTDAGWAFGDVDGMAQPRLLSHHLLGGGLVAALWPLGSSLSAFTAVVLYAHVVCDLLRDSDVA